MLRSEGGREGQRSRRAWLVAAVVWAALIFASSAIPSGGSPEGEVTLRGVLLHVGEFAVLAALLMRAGLGVSVAVLAAVAYGATDELHQAFVPGRDASALDLAFDAVGALLAAAVSGLRRSEP